MKFRTFLLFLIILAQIGWIAYLYVYRSQELATAPSICVRASLEPLHREPLGLYPHKYELKDSPLFGKSLWWDAESWVDLEDGAEPPTGLSQRPDPGDAVKGSLKLTPPVSYNDSILLSAIWTKGEDGIWNFRLEAPGSSEDVLREGELRTEAALWKTDRYIRIQCDDQSETPKQLVLVMPIVPSSAKKGECVKRWAANIEYQLNNDDEHTLRNWLSNMSEQQKKSIPCTMEIALREHCPPMVTQVYINGVRAHDAIEQIRQHRFKTPEAEQSSKQANDNKPEPSEGNPD